MKGHINLARADIKTGVVAVAVRPIQRDLALHTVNALLPSRKEVLNPLPKGIEHRLEEAPRLEPHATINPPDHLRLDFDVE